MILPTEKNTPGSDPEIVIVISHRESFENGVQPILDQLQEKGAVCRAVYIEDGILDAGLGPDRKVVYILTNVAGINELAGKLGSQGHSVVSRQFFAGDNSKFHLQETIKRAGVKVPEAKLHPVRTEIDSDDFPAYVKSQRQVSFVVRVSNVSEFEAAVKLLEMRGEDWYLEKAVEGAAARLLNIKYIAGQVVADEDVSRFRTVLERIADEFKIEVFSVEMFVRDPDESWVIDINPAPAFLRSDEARAHLVDFLVGKRAEVQD